MACSAEKIAEKKREAMERLKRTKETLQAPKQAVNANNSTSRGTAPKPSVQFYGNQNPDKAIALNQYEFKMNNQVPHSSSNRVFSQPYPRSNQNPNKTAPSNQKVASVFNKMVTCTCQMISHKRFEVKESRYYAKLIDVFKSIPTRSYGKYDWNWLFIKTDLYYWKFSFRSWKKNLVVRFERIWRGAKKSERAQSRCGDWFAAAVRIEAVARRYFKCRIDWLLIELFLLILQFRGKWAGSDVYPGNWKENCVAAVGFPEVWCRVRNKKQRQMHDRWWHGTWYVFLNKIFS